MPIEDTLKALTAALTEHTAALNKFVSAAKADAPDAPKASAKATAKAKPKKAEKPLKDQMAEAAGAYLKAGDADDRKAAAANVKKILARFEADRLTNIADDDLPAALEALQAFAAGEDPDLDGDDDGDGALV